MNQSNCMVAQSGGPTSAINASLAGVISGVTKSGKYDICYGAINGILGILNENYLNLSDSVENEEKLARLMRTPAMYLGSCRHKLPNYKDDDSPYIFIFNQFAKFNIKAFFYIGGNDSMDTVLKLSDYAAKINSDIRIIGIPKTIDNDLCMIDHTPGFGSAAKYIASTMLEVAHDTFIYAVKSVTIVEIMGRDAGWLTAASALARNEYNTAPHFIYLPEVVLYTSSISEIRNGAMYSGITLSMIFKSVPSVTEVYCNRDEKTIRNGISDNIIKNADCAEYALILSRLHFPINDITFPIIFQIIMSLFLPSLRLFPR